MKPILCLALVMLATHAHASPASGKTITLRCVLTNTPPRHGGHVPDSYKQHFRVNLAEGTVDGKRATITADQISWEPRQSYLRPAATLSLPGWRYHSARQIGTEPYEVNGTCVEVK